MFLIEQILKNYNSVQVNNRKVNNITPYKKIYYNINYKNYDDMLKNELHFNPFFLTN